MRYYHADELNGKLEPFVSSAVILSKVRRYCVCSPSELLLSG